MLGLVVGRATKRLLLLTTHQLAPCELRDGQCGHHFGSWFPHPLIATIRDRGIIRATLES